ncbi:MAG: nucleotidyltransferase domain-containing protein [Prevotella sp.]|nr:nucleotidyltransferase domain-containing protein [Prevotella sp.]
MKRPQIVRQIKDAVNRTDPTATAILYGSEARGDARPDSDIDVLILMDGDKMDWDRRDAIVNPLYDIEWATGVQISPMVILRKEWENRPFKTPFYINVKNEGVRL